MTPLTIVLLSIQGATLLLGLLVYLNNSKRLVNKQFLVLSLHLTAWAFCVLRIIESTDTASATFWIRSAFFVTAFFPGSFTLLLSSIKQGTLTWLQLYARHTATLLLNLVAAGLALTPFFMVRVVFPEQVVEGSRPLPEAVYGPGYYIYIIYFIVICMLAIKNFYRVYRESEGIERYELQFILYGFSASFVVGAIAALLLPLLLGTNQTSQYGPLGIILLDGIISYGITTRRILGIATILQRITAYTLLCLYLVAVYFTTWLGTSYLLSRFFDLSPQIPHFLATATVALSLAPVQGRFQSAAHRLIASKLMDIPKTMKEANAIFQSVTTIDALLNHYTNLLSSALDTQNISVALLDDGHFVQSYPKEPQDQLDPIAWDNPLCQLIRSTGEPVSKDTLARTRQTKLIHDAEALLTEMDCSIAVGIFSKAKLRGMVLLGARMDGRIYVKSEQDALQLLCNQFAVALENAQMYTEVQDSKIRNDIMLDQLVSGVIVADPERKITLINHEAQRITGLAEEQVLGGDLQLLPASISSVLETTLTTKQGIQNTDAVMFANDDESVIHVRLGSAYLYGHDEKPMGALLVFTDMTEVKGLEEQVRRADQLSSVGTLAAGMAHEIKNPLVTIKTFTQLLPERYSDADFRKDFSSLVAHEVSRIDTIVNHLLNFSKPTQPNLVPMRLHATVEKTLELINEQLAQKNIELQSSLQAQEDLISGDADLLTQSLVNFNLNAIEAIGNDGTIRVSSSNCSYLFARGEDPGDAVSRFCICLQINDSGKGIAHDQLQKIFDPFYTSKSEGTGMGLSVAHGIIHEHHGAIEVESLPGKGTTFSIYIPVLEEEVSAA